MSIKGSMVEREKVSVERVNCTVKSRIPTKTNHFNLFYYKTTKTFHLAICFNNNTSNTLNQGGILKTHNNTAGASTHTNTIQECLVRIHSCCLTGEILGSFRCDCGEQLRESLKELEAQGGILIYLNQEGRGIGLEDKLLAYNLIDNGFDTLSANVINRVVELGRGGDEREYGVAAGMLLDLGIKRVTLMTNNLDKVKGLEENGIKVISRKPLLPKDWTTPTTINGNVKERDEYLKTKREKMGHLLPIPFYSVDNDGSSTSNGMTTTSITNETSETSNEKSNGMTTASITKETSNEKSNEPSTKFNHDGADQVDRYDHLKIVSCLEHNQN